jgi:hypothetical protein
MDAPHGPLPRRVLALEGRTDRSRSSGVERFLGKEEVMGSIPIASSLDCDRARAGGGPGRRPAVGRWSHGEG